MISKHKNPIEWAAFMYELEDASEHLLSLIKQLTSSEECSEEDFGVQMAHVYSHLNHAWHSRNTIGTHTETQIGAASGYPKDLEPI